MASTNKTTNLELPQYITTDTPKMADYNDAYKKIDDALGNTVDMVVTYEDDTTETFKVVVD